MIEVGSLCGAFLLGYASDLTFSKRSPVAILAVGVTSFIMFHTLFEHPKISFFVLEVYLFTFGFFMGGLHHLLCVTCSADIGQNQALKNNKQATGTVTGIIDGLGSLGTALGQLLLGYTIQ